MASAQMTNGNMKLEESEVIDEEEEEEDGVPDPSMLVEVKQ